MKVTSKDLNTISNNLCLPKDCVGKVLRACPTVGDVATVDLGLRDKKLETKVKESMIALLFKLNSNKKGY